MIKNYWHFILPAVIILGIVGYISVTDGDSGQQINTAQLAELIEQDKEDIYFLDVREDHEFKEGHIEGMSNVPLSKLDKEYSQIPKDKTIVVICRSGKRSLQAVSKLKDYGYNDLINVNGGMLEWDGKRIR